MTLTSRDKEKIRGIIREELSEQLSPAASSPEADDDETPPVREQLAAVNERAKSVMNARDVIQAAEDGLTAREYLAEYKGVDATEHATEAELQRAVAETAMGDE